jgi:hypothetical protein
MITTRRVRALVGRIVRNERRPEPNTNGIVTARPRWRHTSFAARPAGMSDWDDFFYSGWRADPARRGLHEGATSDEVAEDIRQEREAERFEKAHRTRPWMEVSGPNRPASAAPDLPSAGAFRLRSVRVDDAYRHDVHRPHGRPSIGARDRRSATTASSASRRSTLLRSVRRLARPVERKAAFATYAAACSTSDAVPGRVALEGLKARGRDVVAIDPSPGSGAERKSPAGGAFAPSA